MKKRGLVLKQLKSGRWSEFAAQIFILDAIIPSLIANEFS
jgi:hypothetical protein